MNLRPYEDGDYERLVAFLKESWAPSHPLYNRALFDWQYRGGASQVIEDNGAIVGFTGAISNTYLLRNQPVSGTAVALWVVAERFWQSGLGVMMVREIQRTHDVTISVRVNDLARKIYEGMGYSSLPALHRAVVPLQPQPYRALLEDPAAAAPDGLTRWAASVRRDPSGAPREAAPDPAALEALFDRSVAPAFALSVKRDAEYWRWRYLNHPVLRYRFFGDPGRDGVVVARTEEVLSEAGESSGLKVIRLIELIPPSPAAFRGESDETFLRLLARVLDVARAEGCAAADYQSSHNRLAGLLVRAGFHAQATGDPMAGLVQLFQPFRRGVSPINAVWRAGDGPKIDRDDTYIMKSDGDMDRPRTA